MLAVDQGGDAKDQEDDGEALEYQHGFLLLLVTAHVFDDVAIE